MLECIFSPRISIKWSCRIHYNSDMNLNKKSSKPQVNSIFRYKTYWIYYLNSHQLFSILKTCLKLQYFRFLIKIKLYKAFFSQISCCRYLKAKYWFKCWQVKCGGFNLKCCVTVKLTFSLNNKYFIILLCRIRGMYTFDYFNVLLLWRQLTFIYKLTQYIVYMSMRSWF